MRSEWQKLLDCLNRYFEYNEYVYLQMEPFLRPIKLVQNVLRVFHANASLKGVRTFFFHMQVTVDYKFNSTAL